jgi:long-chain fatty acid transport protein
VPDGSGQLQAAPNRYLLAKQSGLILSPTLGVGYEVLDGLRIGASFSWGIARLKLASAVAALNADGTTPSNDIRANVQVEDYFVPAFSLGSLWSATPNVDIAAWYKWSDAINARGDVGTAANFYTRQNAAGDNKGVRYGDTIFEDCGTGLPTTACGSGGNARVKLVVPMEAKLGVRFHVPRARAVTALHSPAAEEDAASGYVHHAPGATHLRDPLATDVWDLEADLTWANNSALDNVEIRFPSDASGKGLLPVAGVAGGEIPPNADQKRAFRDVLGVRVGGDYNVVPETLALRAGTFFETSAASSQYQNIDFAASARFGLAAGATYRVKIGRENDAEHSSALEFMAGFGHVFFAEQSRTDPNASGTAALAGTSCNKATPIPGTQTCGDGSARYRTQWPVNLGTITNSVNVINAGVAYRF